MENKIFGIVSALMRQDVISMFEAITISSVINHVAQMNADHPLRVELRELYGTCTDEALKQLTERER